MTRISLPLVIGCVIAAGGCASSQTDRHAAPYALLIPGGETAPDPLPQDTRLIETEPRPADDALQSPETRLARARRLYRDLAFEASLEELRRAQVELEAELGIATTGFAELDRQARAIGAWLQSKGLAGQRTLLLYPPGLEFGSQDSADPAVVLRQR